MDMEIAPIVSLFVSGSGDTDLLEVRDLYGFRVVEGGIGFREADGAERVKNGSVPKNGPHFSEGVGDGDGNASCGTEHCRRAESVKTTRGTLQSVVGTDEVLLVDHKKLNIVGERIAAKLFRVVAVVQHQIQLKSVILIARFPTSCPTLK